VGALTVASARLHKASSSASVSGPPITTGGSGGLRVLIQGFGNVGANAAFLLDKLGASIVGVGDHTSYLLEPDGLDVEDLIAYEQQNGSLAGVPGAIECSRDDFFAAEAEVLIPAALEGQITEVEALMLTVDVVAEGANGPVTPDGEAVLTSRGVEIIPDVLANSGGVMVSYYEWTQNKRSERWEYSEVATRLESAMTRAYCHVRDTAKELGCSFRIAAYAIALKSLAECYAQRGIFP
jgi:glutamate dehydrogenase (NAD(P)+)